MSTNYQPPQTGEPIPKSTAPDEEKIESTHGAPSACEVREACIHRLPVELLEKVFRMVMEEIDPRCIQPLLNQPPLLFLQVCRNWKNGAISMSRLWSTIALILERGSDSIAQNAHTLETWLNRSTKQHLSIFITFPEASVHPHAQLAITPECLPLIQLIIPHASRWESISLWRVPDVLLVPLRSLKQDATPSLKHLDISLDLPSNDIIDHLGFYNMSSMLSTLSIRGRFGRGLSRIVPNSLTSLSLSWERSEAPRINDFIQILHKMPSLASLCASVPLDLSDADETINQQIPLPNLKKLELDDRRADGDSQGVLGRIFNCLTLQSLEVFIWNSNLVSPSDWEVETFIHMVRRSECRLDTLYWPALDFFDEPLLIELLSDLSTVKNLMTEGLTKTIAAWLKYDPVRPTECLLPKLEWLILIQRYHLSCTDMELAQMIHSRCNIGNEGPATGIAISHLRYVELSGLRSQVFDANARHILDECDTSLIFNLSYDLVPFQEGSDAMQVVQDLIEDAVEDEGTEDSFSDEDE